MHHLKPFITFLSYLMNAVRRSPKPKAKQPVNLAGYSLQDLSGFNP